MNQAAPNSEMNNMNGLTDMMNNLSLEQMNNYDNNPNFSPFNMNNEQMMNMNINNWDDGTNDLMNQFNQQNFMGHNLNNPSKKTSKKLLKNKM